MNKVRSRWMLGAIGLLITACPDDPATTDGADTTEGMITVPTTGDLVPTEAGVCGDGVVDGDEACDDGNIVNDDACTNDCRAPSCGDGIVQTDEACDDGNDIDTDACTSVCRPPSCGDAVVQGDEACDDGNDVDTDACTSACMLPSCGDAVVQGSEACDDGNDIDTDACTSTCQPARCGDGFVQGSEACDDGNGVDVDACTTLCALASCGDGFVQMGEVCDDANDVETDACRSTCVAAECGDSIVWAGEETCDDGNLDDTDDCPTTCTAAACGDGFEWAGVEVCDDGNPDASDGCLPDCTHATSCAVIHQIAPMYGNGVYTLVIGSEELDVYCDMKTDLGGWTLVARFANSDDRNWMADTGEWWYSRTASAGEPTFRNKAADAFSPAFFQVKGQEFKLSRTDSLDDAHLLRTIDKCLDGKTFREHITSYGDFQNDMSWGSNGVLGSCYATISDDATSTHGFEYAECEGDIGAPFSISFWAAWPADAAVMMIGGGGDACGGADHGIGITEANIGKFSYTDNEDDFGIEGNAGSNSDPYGINLFVR